MHLLKQKLVDAYYYATAPYRALWMMRARAARKAPVMILFYHRVADDAANAWTCPTDLFARQMNWVRERYDVVTLGEAQRRLRQGHDRPAVCITFDDGYADNNDFALPLLVEKRMACTYFVTLHNAQTGEPFPHDAALGRPLRPNTIDDLRHWADAGIEIGGHTRTHPDLGSLYDPDRLYDEIVVAGRELGEAVDRPLRYFAAPFGLPQNLQPLVFEMAREAGYEAVCSAYGGYNLPGDDSFHLQRIHADDDFARFRNWLTIDPRKLSVPRYSATTQPCPAEPVAVG